MPSLSIVIPVYRSEESLPLLLDALAEELPRLSPSYEVILVEDDGGDGSWAVIEQATTRHNWVRGIKLMRNYGQHSALLCGIRAAKYDVIVTMDDDLQHPPSEIAALLAQIEAGYDAVYGRPRSEKHGLLRDMASQVTKLVLQQAMGAETARNISAFRAFRAPLKEAFVSYHGPYVNIDVLLTWGTRRFIAIPVQHMARPYGKSNYTLSKLITHTFNMVTGFSTVPLQAASMLGFALTAFGALMLFYIIVIRIVILGYDVPGFTFLASLVSIFAGAQMFMLGIMGEYLARMHFRLMDKPSYVIRHDKTGDEPSGETETADPEQEQS